MLGEWMCGVLLCYYQSLLPIPLLYLLGVWDPDPGLSPMAKT